MLALETQPRDAVKIVALLMEVESDLGHPGPKDAMDGAGLGRFELDVVAVEVELLLVFPPVAKIAIGISLRHDEEVETLEQRAEPADREVAAQLERGLLGGLLVAVLRSDDEDGRLGPVERRRRGHALLCNDHEKQVGGREILRRKGPADRRYRDPRRGVPERAQKAGDIPVLRIARIARLLRRRLEFARDDRRGRRVRQRGKQQKDGYQAVSVHLVFS